MQKSRISPEPIQRKSAQGRTFLTALVVLSMISACSSSDDDEDPTALVPDEESSELPQTGNPGDGTTSMPSPSFDLVPQVRTVASVGDIYTNDDGGALYTRFTDEPGVITCTLTCAQSWPPLTTSVTDEGISGNFDVIAREDGTSQWTLLGYPLYSFSGDAAPDDVSGDGVDNQWALARPIPTTSAAIDGEEALVASGTTRSDGTSNTRTDRNEFTLYVFANDTAGVSNCNDGCATSWPPLYADTGAVADGNRYSLITREDGTQQWAYDEQALYFWQGDTAAGEFSGQDVPNWSIAQP